MFEREQGHPELNLSACKMGAFSISDRCVKKFRLFLYAGRIFLGESGVNREDDKMLSPFQFICITSYLYSYHHNVPF